MQSSRNKNHGTFGATKRLVGISNHDTPKYTMLKKDEKVFVPVKVVNQEEQKNSEDQAVISLKEM